MCLTLLRDFLPLLVQRAAVLLSCYCGLTILCCPLLPLALNWSWNLVYPVSLNHIFNWFQSTSDQQFHSTACSVCLF